MHRITAAHLESFADSFGFKAEPVSYQFELFTNYTILSSRLNTRFDVEDITTSESDDSIDGIAITIDETIFSSKEDSVSEFNSDRKNHDVEIFFIQSKTSETFDLGDFLKFKDSILRFLTSDNYEPDDDVLKDSKEILEVVLKNVPKIRNGRPSFSGYYVTTGRYQSPTEFERAKEELIAQLEELGLFNEISFSFIDRDELTKKWASTYSSIDTSIEMFSHAPLPNIAGIDESYLAVIKAKDYVENLLMYEDGNLRTSVFEENVRSFLGTSNPVNQSIEITLNSGDTATRFPVLNNGITIVSPDVRVQNNVLHLVNYQIVNGCQTSNVLYENLQNLNDSVMITIKVIETSNEDIFSELVRATNSQTQVEEKQFLSLRPIVKRIEQYFNTYIEEDYHLYFERRDKQFMGQNVPAIRIFSLHDLTRCVASMFCRRPDLASRYHKQMYSDLTDVIYKNENAEIIFFASALALYRLHLFVSNSTIPQNMRKFKWHILMLVKEILTNSQNHNLNSRRATQQCAEIISILSEPSEKTISIYRQAVDIVLSLGDISRDRLKRQAIIQEMLDCV